MTAGEVLRETERTALFNCPVCRKPVGERDFFDLGLRPPDRGETREEYCDAELVDDVTHLDCTGGADRG